MANSKDKTGDKPLSIVVDGKFIGTDLTKLEKNKVFRMNFVDTIDIFQKKKPKRKIIRIFLKKAAVISLIGCILFVLVAMGIIYYFLGY
jgi:hypothetical protein